MAQLSLLLLIAIFDIIAWKEKLRFLKECKDDIEVPSRSGVISRSFTLTVIFLWRAVTATMCVFFIGHARQLPKSEENMIEHALSVALSKENGEDDLLSEDDESEMSNEAYLQAGRARQYQAKVRRRKRELILVILSISRGRFKSI